MEQRGRKRAQTFRARCPRNGANEPKNSCQPLRLFALRAAWLEAVAALRRGKTVEQLLSAESHGGQPTVRWLSVHPHDGAFVVGLHHVFDPCDPELLDVTEFAPVMSGRVSARASRWPERVIRRSRYEMPAPSGLCRSGG
jgi:hypothetical protein